MSESRGDGLAAPDPPPYPREWGWQERVAAYWAARHLGRPPTHTSGWYGIVSRAQQLRETHPNPMLYDEDTQP